MKLYALLILVIVTSCQVKPDGELDTDKLTVEDSLKVQDELLLQMREELYENEYVEVNKDTSFFNPETGCYPRPHFSIKINRQHQIMVRNELNAPIIPRLLEYYLANRKKNDPSTNFPLYARSNSQEIQNQINYLNKELSEKIKNKASADEIELLNDVTKEWERKLKALKTLPIDFFPEVNTYVQIEIDPRSKIDTSPIVDTVLFAFYLLRDQASKEYFGESYISIYNRYNIENSTLDSDKLDALVVLYPLRIIDEANLKLYKHFIINELIPPPPMPPLIEPIIEEEVNEIEPEPVIVEPPKNK